MGAPFNVLPPGATDLVAPLMVIIDKTLKPEEKNSMQKRQVLIAVLGITKRTFCAKGSN